MDYLPRLRGRLDSCWGEFPSGRLDDAMLQSILAAFASEDNRVTVDDRAVIGTSSKRSFRIALPRLTMALAGILAPIADLSPGGHQLTVPIALAIVAALGAFEGSVEPVQRDDAEILVILHAQGLGGGSRRVLPYGDLVATYARRLGIDVSRASAEVDDALARLKNLDCVDEEPGRIIVLKEIVAVVGGPS